MVFFNYSTMQMAAKVVYYGPGLCGKTTNLQYIYNHTANDSRGEMVSLETETDRTLFFDLLPIDVGSIAGFNTRIQLYTVPGQVFYNTTRKLVLKGVDGVVFVADSQRPMLAANAESLRNLEENLAEMGLSFETLPIVLQYNKRDLPDVIPVEEMERSLNGRGWPSFEASAKTGEGVFETLKGISKLTLVSLKKRLTKMGGDSATSRPAARPIVPRPAAAPPSRPTPPPPAAPTRAAAPAVSATKSAQRPKASQVDVLAELEKIRKQAMGGANPPAARSSASGSHPKVALPSAPPTQAPAAPPATPFRAPSPARPAAPAASGAFAKAATNGKGEIHRSVELTLKRAEFDRAKRFLLNLRVEDGNQHVVDAIKDLPIDIQDAASLEKVLLQLHVAVKSKD